MNKGLKHGELQKVERLPKWAQERIKRLEIAIDASEQMRKELNDTIGKTKMRWRLHYDDSHNIPDGSRIEIELGDSILEVYIKRDEPEVYSHRGSIVVHPHVTNVISIALRDL